MSAPAVAAHRAPAVLAVLAPLVALALVLTVPKTAAPPDGTGAPTRSVTEPVARSTVACPPAPPVGRATRVAVVAGAVPGAVAAVPARTGRGTVLTRTGGEARGTFAARVDRGGDTLAVLACRQPAAQWWFAGAGGDLDHSSVLHLVNVDSGPAVVDVRLHGATGSVDLAGTRGLTLAPGTSVRLRLADVAPGSAELTVEVAASRGRVVAGVVDAVGTGREWLPPTTPPARSVVVPGGVAAVGGSATLVVTNPGDAQALVGVEALGPGGAFTPVGVEPLSVEPGAVVAADLGTVLGDAAAVRVTADRPVVAALRTTTRGDHAVAAGAPPLPQGNPAALVVAGRRSVVRLASDAGARVRVVERTAGGRLLVEEEIDLPAGGSVERLPRARTASVTVDAVDGDVRAAAVHEGGGVAVQPAPPVPWTVLRPAVRPPAR